MNPTKSVESTKAEGQLVVLAEARRALVKVASVDQAKKIRDQAEALRNYAKQQQLGLESQNAAAEIKIRAERRAGELLAKVQRGSGPPTKGKERPTPHPGGLTYEQTIKSAGIAPTTADRWQEIATIPEPQFEVAIATVKAEKDEITSAGMLNLSRKIKADSDPTTMAKKAAREAPKVKLSGFITRLSSVVALVSDRKFKGYAGTLDGQERRHFESEIKRAINALKVLL